jgi:hypothetical protein
MSQRQEGEMVAPGAPFGSDGEDGAADKEPQERIHQLRAAGMSMSQIE